MSSKRSYAKISDRPAGYNKSTRTVGGRVLTYRPSAPVFGSSRYMAAMSARAAKETGYVDVAFSSYAMDTTGSVTHLTIVPQGTAVTNRVGKKIALKGLQCRGFATAGLTGVLNNVAFMIVYDKRPTGSLPAVTDILVSANASAMNNDNNSGRFQILKRWDDVLVGTTVSISSTKPIINTDWWLDLKGRQTVYKAAATGQIADVEEGALYLVTVGSTAAGTGAAELTVGFRLRFLDI